MKKTFSSLIVLFIVLSIFGVLPSTADATVVACTPYSQTIVSSMGDTVDGGSAVAAWVHGTWATITGANWIWHEAQVSNPTSDETDVFTKTINLPGNVSSASIDIASDNGYIIKINGVTVVGADKITVEMNYGAITTHDVTSYLNPGSNTLEITVKNFGLTGSTYDTNPAGLIYKLTIDGCQSTGTINVCKIVTDINHAIVSGVGATTFTIPWLANANYEGSAVGIPTATTMFTTPLTLNTNLNVGGVVNNAQCIAYNNLPVGRYYYGQEQIGSGETWATPKYNDEANMTVSSLSDLQEFNSNLDTQYDNFDGVINVSAGQTRTLIVLNHLVDACPNLAGDQNFGDDCTPPAPTTATIVAQKIICDNESDLPNWGAGDSTLQQVTSNTATRFLSIHPTCHLEKWIFEYAPNGTSNPGDNVGVAGSPWVSFHEGLVTVPAGSRIWVREQANSNYVPFSGDISSNDGWDAVSAEIYCSNDTLNYDNYDYIDPVVAGQIYYCVAFNAPKEVPVTTSTVTMCKTDDAKNPLSGWSLMLMGDKYGSVNVNPDGVEYKLTSIPAGNYVLKASGQYTYRPGSVGAEYSDAAYSKRLSSDAVYGGAYVPWVRENDFPVPHTGWLGIIFNDSFTNWGSTYNSLHTYALGTTTSSTSDFAFKIFDDVYSDNSGNLTVDVYPGYQGYTNTEGCVTFTDVPYGTYKKDEILQDNWSNVSGLGEALVDEPTETFYIVNHDNSVPPAPVCVPVELIQNGSFEFPVVSPSSFSIIPNSDLLLKWLVAWFGSPSSGTLGLEIQNHVAGDPAVGSGDQFAELDGDHPVTISQDVATVPGLTYALNFKYSPRPGRDAADNAITVQVNGSPVTPVLSVDGSSNTNTVWSSETRTFTATGATTKIEFVDTGTDTSYGGYLDDVSLKCVTDDVPPQDPVCTENQTLINHACVNNPTPTCSDGIQNQNETDVDMGEVCENDLPPSEPAPNNRQAGGGGGVIMGLMGQVNGQVQGASTSNGQVLGESCGLYMDKYLRLISQKNDSEQVRKLQQFLNKWMDSELPVTGFYGPMTKAEVQRFQTQYSDDILKPWGLNTPTGLVYLSTLRKINNLECPDIVPNLPALVPWSQNPNVQN